MSSADVVADVFPTERTPVLLITNIFHTLSVPPDMLLNQSTSTISLLQALSPESWIVAASPLHLLSPFHLPRLCQMPTSVTSTWASTGPQCTCTPQALYHCRFWHHQKRVPVRDHQVKDQAHQDHRDQGRETGRWCGTPCRHQKIKFQVFLATRWSTTQALQMMRGARRQAGDPRCDIGEFVTRLRSTEKDCHLAARNLWYRQGPAVAGLNWKMHQLQRDFVGRLVDHSLQTRLAGWPIGARPAGWAGPAGWLVCT